MLTDQDLELLEAYLDDALTADEVEQVAHRLSDDPALLAALQSMRAERTVRAAVFTSLEPTPAEADAISNRIIRSVRRSRLIGIGWRASQFAAAAAASILLGLGGGWFIWGRGHLSPSQAMPTVAVNNIGSVAPQTVGDSTIANLPPGPYQVALTDEHGNVLAMQKFDRFDEAKQFANDLGQAEERRQDVQNGKAMLVADHF
jgi:anti-sigma factor RsiW